VICKSILKTCECGFGHSTRSFLSEIESDGIGAIKQYMDFPLKAFLSEHSTESLSRWIPIHETIGRRPSSLRLPKDYDLMKRLLKTNFAIIPGICIFSDASQLTVSDVLHGRKETTTELVRATKRRSLRLQTKNSNKKAMTVEKPIQYVNAFESMGIDINVFKSLSSGSKFIVYLKSSILLYVSLLVCCFVYSLF
jgi:hypothetical protein